MKSKLIGFIFYILLMWGMGVYGGYLIFEDKYNEQLEINKNLYNVIQKKDSSYDELMQQTIEYRWLYESCQTMFGDYQDKVEAGCYVNGGWNCE